jgi:hypothetical protein
MTAKHEETSRKPQTGRSCEEIMIKPWMFEFLFAPDSQGEPIAPQAAIRFSTKGVALWQRMETLAIPS